MSKMEIIKTVYFVRHGQSEDNARPVFQAIESPLSENGRTQAEKVAGRAAKLDFQTLISSTYTRARETAEAIARVTNKTPEYSNLFVERIKPSLINGKSHNDLPANELSKKWYESLFKKGLKVEDGENYEEIVERAVKALDFLKDHPAKDILLVSHGFFLRVMMARVMLGDSMTEENLRNFQAVSAMQNTGVSVLQYSRWNDEVEPKWRFWIYNDHSHLG